MKQQNTNVELISDSISLMSSSRFAQQSFTCSNSAKETLEKGKKYVQS